MKIAARIVFAWLWACAMQAHAASFSFALIGDAPYGAGEAAFFERLIDEINADPSVGLVLHAGDVKGGREPCDDELLRARYAQLQRLRAPVVFTPGDNDWTDCHRPAAGGFDPLERLAALRAIFFADPRRTSGGAPRAVEPQSALPGFAPFVENVRFVHAGVVFATLHVVGSSNGLEPWRGIDPRDGPRAPRAERLAEFERRQAANLAWLDATFAQARSIDAPAVVLLMHANPRFDLPAGDPQRAGFDALLERLAQRAADFGRPVLLAHGDFHRFVVDRPLDVEGAAPRVPNFVRVQSFGSPWIRWVKVTVDPSAPTPFRFEAVDADGIPAQ
ncbi:MAG: hypothetical protein BroJett031_00310 [Betaproteobacteria bacterium]|nr:MAG: hypothetical protein BroJett031_00310 [Betaproteobacteria bacterium]